MKLTPRWYLHYASHIQEISTRTIGLSQQNAKLTWDFLISFSQTFFTSDLQDFFLSSLREAFLGQNCNTNDYFIFTRIKFSRI